MRQEHSAGDKLFVDYAGDTVTVVVDRLSGKTRQAHLFVAVLGASSLSYSQARWTETLTRLGRMPCSGAGILRRFTGASCP